jgi:hypothetical protein
MTTDRTVSISVPKMTNPILYNRSLPTGDKIKCIIKNNQDEELIFKDQQENWTPYIAKRVKNCDIRSSLCEDMRYYFPTLDLRTKHFTLKDVKQDSFNHHEYIFEMNLIVDKYVLVTIPASSLFKEFNWKPTKEQVPPVAKEDKETKTKIKNKLIKSTELTDKEPEKSTEQKETTSI